MAPGTHTLARHAPCGRPAHSDDYKRYFNYMKELNANTVRIYTTLSPDFYASLKEFNDAEMAAGRKPILVLHGIWSPEEELNDDEAGTDAFRTDLTNHFYRNIESVVGAVHGAGYFEVRRARAHCQLEMRAKGSLTLVAMLGAIPCRLGV